MFLFWKSNATNLAYPVAESYLFPQLGLWNFRAGWNIRNPFFLQGTEISISLYYHRVPDKFGT